MDFNVQKSWLLAELIAVAYGNGYQKIKTTPQIAEIWEIGSQDYLTDGFYQVPAIFEISLSDQQKEELSQVKRRAIVIQQRCYSIVARKNTPAKFCLRIEKWEAAEEACVTTQELEDINDLDIAQECLNKCLCGTELINTEKASDSIQLLKSLDNMNSPDLSQLVEIALATISQGSSQHASLQDSSHQNFQTVLSDNEKDVEKDEQKMKGIQMKDLFIPEDQRQKLSKLSEWSMSYDPPPMPSTSSLGSNLTLSQSGCTQHPPMPSTSLLVSNLTLSQSGCTQHPPMPSTSLLVSNLTLSQSGCTQHPPMPSTSLLVSNLTLSQSECTQHPPMPSTSSLGSNLTSSQSGCTQHNFNTGSLKSRGMISKTGPRNRWKGNCQPRARTQFTKSMDYSLNARITKEIKSTALSNATSLSVDTRDQSHASHMEQSCTVYMEQSLTAHKEQLPTAHKEQLPTVHKEQSPTAHEEQSLTAHKEPSLTAHEEQSLTVHKEQSLTAHKEQSLTAHEEQSLTAHKEQSLTAHEEQSPTAHKEQSLTAHKEPSLTAHEEQSLTVHKEQSLTAHKEQSLTAHEEQSLTAHEEQSLTAHEEQSLTAHKEPSLTAHEEQSLTAHKEPSLTAHKEPSLTAHEEPSLTAHKEPSLTAHKEQSPTVHKENRCKTISSSGSLFTDSEQTSVELSRPTIIPGDIDSQADYPQEMCQVVTEPPKYAPKISDFKSPNFLSAELDIEEMDGIVESDVQGNNSFLIDLSSGENTFFIPDKRLFKNQVHGDDKMASTGDSFFNWSGTSSGTALSSTRQTSTPLTSTHQTSTPLSSTHQTSTPLFSTHQTSTPLTSTHQTQSTSYSTHQTHNKENPKIPMIPEDKTSMEPSDSSEDTCNSRTRTSLLSIEPSDSSEDTCNSRTGTSLLSMEPSDSSELRSNSRTGTSLLSMEPSDSSELRSNSRTGTSLLSIEPSDSSERRSNSRRGTSLLSMESSIRTRHKNKTFCSAFPTNTETATCKAKVRENLNNKASKKIFVETSEKDLINPPRGSPIHKNGKPLNILERNSGKMLRNDDTLLSALQNDYKLTQMKCVVQLSVDNRLTGPLAALLEGSSCSEMMVLSAYSKADNPSSPTHQADTPLSSIHQAHNLITSTHQTSTPLSSTHQTSTPLSSTHQTSTPLTSTHQTSTSTHQTSTPLSSTRQTSTPLTSTHQTSTPLSSTHQTSTPLSSTHQTSTPLTSTHQTQSTSYSTHQTHNKENPKIPMIPEEKTSMESSDSSEDTCNSRTGNSLFSMEPSDSSELRSNSRRVTSLLSMESSIRTTHKNKTFCLSFPTNTETATCKAKVSENLNNKPRKKIFVETSEKDLINQSRGSPIHKNGKSLNILERNSGKILRNDDTLLSPHQGDYKLTQMKCVVQLSVDNRLTEQLPQNHHHSKQVKTVYLREVSDADPTIEKIAELSPSLFSATQVRELNPSMIKLFNFISSGDKSGFRG